MRRRAFITQQGTTNPQVLNYAYKFNGTTDLISVPFAPLFSQAFVLTFKVMFPAPTGREEWVMGLNGSTGFGLFRLSSSSVIELRIGGGASGTTMANLSPANTTSSFTPYMNNQWQSIRISHNGSGRFTLEVLQGSSSVFLIDQTLVGYSANTEARQFRIAYRGSGTASTNFFSGRLADIRYEQAGDVKFFYKCEEQIGTTAFDSSGKRNHGTITGSIHENIEDPINWANTVGYRLSDGTTFYIDTPPTVLIPNNVVVPRDESNTQFVTAYQLSGDQIPVQGTSGGGGGGGTPPVTGDFYVDPVNGNDSNAGTLESPFRTITKLNTTLTAGKVGILRGGTYDCATSGNINPSNSGTQNSLITYKAYPGEQVTVINANGANTSEKAFVFLRSRSYIKVEGIKFDGEWKLLTAATGGNTNNRFFSTRANKLIYLFNAHYNVFEDCTFEGAIGYTCVEFADEGSTNLSNASSYNKFLKCNFDKGGTWNKNAGFDQWDVNTAGADYADLFNLGFGQYNLLDGCTFKRGGHNLLEISGRFNIVRNCFFDNFWGNDRNNVPVGQRCVEITTRQGGYAGPIYGGYNLFEDNVLVRSYKASDTNYSSIMKVQGSANICRHNYLLFSDTTGARNRAINTDNNTNGDFANLNRIYNNTVYRTGSAAWRYWSATAEGTNANARNNHFKNNLSFQHALNPNGGSNSRDDAFVTLQFSVGTPLLDNKVIGNAYSDNEQNIAVNSTRKTVNDYQTSDPNNFQSNISIPTNTSIFANAAQPNVWTIDVKNGFQTNGTFTGRNNGRELTKTTNSGVASTNLVVDDPYYFFPFVQEIYEGDSILISNQSAVTVLAVNYNTKTITLSAPRTWSVGDNVYLTKTGTTPDIGAYQSNT